MGRNKFLVVLMHIVLLIGESIIFDGIYIYNISFTIDKVQESRSWHSLSVQTFFRNSSKAPTNHDEFGIDRGLISRT